MPRVAFFLAFVVGVIALATWDARREITLPRLAEDIAAVFAPPAYRTEVCRWVRRTKQAPRYECAVRSHEGGVDDLAQRFRGQGWLAGPARHEGSQLFCRAGTAVEVLWATGGSRMEGRAFQLTASPGSTPQLEDWRNATCRKVVHAAREASLPRSRAAATGGPACALFPEPLRASCR